MILVIGSTGKIGLELVKILSGKSVEFKALIRSEERAKLLPDGVKYLVGDFENKTGLEKIIEGTDKLFIATPPHRDQLIHHLNILEAAKKSGIRHIVKVSALGTAENSLISLARWHALSEKAIKGSGIAYTFLHPHSFMQNIFASIDTIRNQNAVYYPIKNGKLSMIDTRDISEVAANILTTNGHEGKTYFLTGPEAISYYDIAKILSEVTNRNISFISVSSEMASDNMIKMGLPEWLVNDLITLAKLNDDGIGENVFPDSEIILGRKPNSFKKFAEDHKFMWS